MDVSVLIAVGGTGGHMVPAETLGATLKKWATVVPVVEQKAPKFSKFKNILSDFCLLFQGFQKNISVLEESRPSVVVGFGSFYTVPMLLAAKWKKIPIILYAPDRLPGRVIRLFSIWAEVTGIQFQEAASFLFGKTERVRTLLREGFQRNSTPRNQCYSYFGLGKLPTLLVFGGSQGAQAINELLIQSAADLKKKLPPFQVVHLVGEERRVPGVKAVYEKEGIPASVRAFEKNIHYAYHIADLVVSRSGAMTVAELLEFALPAFFIPYPYAKDKHQAKNGEFVEKKGGAICRAQNEVTKEVFVATLETLFAEEGKKLQEMKQCLECERENLPKTTLEDLIWNTLQKNTI